MGSALYPGNGLEFAGVGAGAADDALGLVDDMGLFLLAADGAHGAFFGAGRTALALGRVDARLGERLALAGRAMLVEHMRVVFVAEIAQGRKHRVGRRLAQAAHEPFCTASASFSINTRVSPVARPSMMSSSMANNCRVPSRHSTHLPQLSRWVKSMKNRAMLTMHVFSFMATRPPEPTIAPTLRSES